MSPSARRQRFRLRLMVRSAVLSVYSFVEFSAPVISENGVRLRLNIVDTPDMVTTSTTRTGTFFNSSLLCKSRFHASY